MDAVNAVMEGDSPLIVPPPIKPPAPNLNCAKDIEDNKIINNRNFIGTDKEFI